MVKTLQIPLKRWPPEGPSRTPRLLELSEPKKHWFLAPSGAQEMQMYVCLFSPKCSRAHNLYLFHDNFMMTSGYLVPWACIQVNWGYPRLLKVPRSSMQLACSYISLHAFQWASMQSHELKVAKRICVVPKIVRFVWATPSCYLLPLGLTPSVMGRAASAPGTWSGLGSSWTSSASLQPGDCEHITSYK